MRVERFRRTCVALLSASIVSLGLHMPASAGIVGTADAIVAGQPADPLATVMGVMARDDVRDRMIALGVDPADVEARLAALTPAELANLANRLEQAPAGGDLLEVVGLVFVVLLILELTGVIDIFKKA